MSLWKWTRHGQRRCISAYSWEGFGAVLSPSSCCWPFTHTEQLRTRQYRGPVTTTSPFWVDWRSSIASRLTRRDWSATTDDGRIMQFGLSGFPVWGGSRASIWCWVYQSHELGAWCLGYSLLEAIWGSSVAENIQPLRIRWVLRDLL